MKNSILIMCTIFIIVIAIACGIIISEKSNIIESKKANKFYEDYLNKEIYGTDLATIIGKAVEQNLKNGILKDEKGLFIENNENSIKIDLKMITIDKTYPMEAIYNNDITKFVENFNSIKFKCTSIEYHGTTKLISKLIFEEIEE